jgi:cytoskeletal protein CcmA (bactofilin family)
MAVFSKKRNISLDTQAISTFIAEGSVIEGNLKAPDVARLDGHVTGDVSVTEGLILGEKAIINGNVITKHMVVYGLVNGNINVQSLEIKSTGQVNGEIKTGMLSVETGAVYNGTLSMYQEHK